ncbi:serine hydrolase domain-containing protein [Variovorax sp. Varisp36]|uniref:serine hydrolase domain-containing protein n=1 Tax=Variovorax sp. Varisp36 TaxID=3243031 RepID=UPI0039A77672
MAQARRTLLRATATLPAAAFSAPSEETTALKASADAVLARAVAYGDTAGVAAAVITRDQTLYAGAQGARTLGATAAMDLDTVMFIASMTKPITSAAAMQLVEQGRLSLDDPAAAVVPELGALKVLQGWDANDAPLLRDAEGQLTLRHLLTHTSGFAYEIWNANLGRFCRTQNIPGVLTGQKAALRVPLCFDPGTRWEYGLGIDWVGQLVEAASGLSLGEYFQRNITGPLGMDSTAFKISAPMRTRLAGMHLRGDDGKLSVIDLGKVQDPEFESGGAGLYSTANDYLKFMRMILNGGQGNGNQILRPETVALMSRNAMGALRVRKLPTQIPFFSRDVEFFPGVPTTWSLGFLVNEGAAPTGRSAGSLAWAGLANTYFWIDPSLSIAGLAMTQALPFSDPRTLDLFHGFEKSVYASLNCCPEGRITASD